MRLGSARDAGGRMRGTVIARMVGVCTGAGTRMREDAAVRRGAGIQIGEDGPLGAFSSWSIG